MPGVREVVELITNGLSTETEKAVALHNYVRDSIKFGFNRYFDLSTPDHTLELGIGHCNPQGELMTALFRAADLETYMHFVVLPKVALKGAVSPSRYWLIPPELSHCYTEVRVEGTWCNTDSYILDSPFLKAARAKLSEEGRISGYGTHVKSTNQWDGKSDAFSQFDKDMMLEDHGRVDDLDTYYRSDRYRHKVLGVRLNTLFRLLGKSLEARSKLYLDSLREHYSKSSSV